MEVVEGRRSISMSETRGQRSDGVYRYFVKGEREPYTGVLYAQYDDGQLLSWQEYVDGVGQGKWINYYNNGQVQETGYFEQNRVEGPIKKYHPNGQLQAVGTYKNWRIRVGVWRYYDAGGTLLRTVDYGTKGSIEEVQDYYDRGDISNAWYTQILRENGF